MYLLNCDAEREEIRPAQFRGYVPRSAALAELAIGGLLSGQGGKVAANTGTPPGDPLLAEILHDISLGKPRHWITVVQLNVHKAEALVREQLAAKGEITDEESRAKRWIRSPNCAVLARV